ncbi:glutamate-5-semialdehyde dehydrogenase [Demetria terragena]|uniref:glutamate-5-semialdehyde dehydrogenase n=1 Tax=Demetria terragena TaxID=63959 RepID=UPI00036F1F4F|nr:glutamate-5-semialdehyde dehydrogenase [Demetria terragena]
MNAEAADRVRTAALAARTASRELALLPRADKDRALEVLANAVKSASERILAANSEDITRGEAGGLRANLVDRLRLTPDRVDAVAEALRSLAALPDPVGEIVRGSTLANGLEITQVQVPMGVVGMIYEARPNVTVDAAGLGLKSGNAMILRGGSAAASTNAALVGILREALAQCELPTDTVQLLEGGRDDVTALLSARGLVDLVIPRGGADLIKTVVSQATVPVIETGVGNCHVYVDRAADLDMALAITLNSKTHRPSVCNAAESLLVHEAVADEYLPRVLGALGEAGVLVHADPKVEAVARQAGVAHDAVTDEDWGSEHLALEMSVGVVGSLDDALTHIGRYGTQHTEAIVTQDRAAARRFVAEIDAAAVLVNASTRFTDGGEFGFGAEIGISTQKLHARGPMALKELTTTKWVVQGDGQVRA